MPESEDQIEEFVANYFTDLGFMCKRQHNIMIGSQGGIPDIVIFHQSVRLTNDPLDAIAAIVECKAENRVGDGIKQLHSYLCATDTRLGVFANSRSPEKWLYYENYGRNDIKPINRNHFRRFLDGERLTRAEREQARQARTDQLVYERARKSVSQEAINQCRERIINSEARSRITEDAIPERTKQLVDEEAKTLVSPEVINQCRERIINNEARSRITEDALQARTEQLVDQKAMTLVSPEDINQRKELIIDTEASSRITEGDYRSAVERSLQEKVRVRNGWIWFLGIASSVLLFIVFASI